MEAGHQHRPTSVLTFSPVRGPSAFRPQKASASTLVLADEKGPLPGENHVYRVEIDRPGTYQVELTFRSPEIGLAVAPIAADVLKNRVSRALKLEVDRSALLSEEMNMSPLGEVSHRSLVQLNRGINKIRVGGLFQPLGPVSYTLVLAAKNP